MAREERLFYSAELGVSFVERTTVNRYDRVMKKYFFLLPLLLSFSGCLEPALENRRSVEPIRVLILGDSISMGYTEHVRDALGERAFVMRARKPDGEKPENCHGTSYAIHHLDRWLAQGGGKWDVIHFNFGLHDLKRVHPETRKNSDNPEDPHQADLDLYARQLEEIVQGLGASGARLIFATTTPVPEGVSPYRDPSDPLDYNRVAVELMQRYDVAVNDLFAYANPRLEVWQRLGNVHFHPEGSRALGEEVARVILQVAGLDLGG